MTQLCLRLRLLLFVWDVVFHCRSRLAELNLTRQMLQKLFKLAGPLSTIALLMFGCSRGITPKSFLEDVISTNYGLTLPKSYRLLNFVDDNGGTVPGASRSNTRYAKIQIDLSDFKELDQSITKRHGNMLSGSLVRQNRDDLGWWDNTQYEVCYYTKLVGTQGGMALHVYLLRQGTNALVLLEEIPGER